MSTLVEIPGVGEVEFPDSMSPADIEQAARGLVGEGVQQQQPPQQPVGMLDAAGRSFVNRAAENALSLPGAVVEAATPQTGFQPGQPRGLIPDPIEAASAGLSALGRGVKAITPTSTDIRAGLQTASEIPGAIAGGEDLAIGERFRLAIGERFRRAQQEQLETDVRFAEQAPISTAAGKIGADVLTVLTGRPAARAATGAVSRQLPSRARVPGAPGIEKKVNKIFENKFAKSLGRGVGRTAETGVEGAALAVLDGQDPGQIAALSAGSQAVGSAALFLSKHPIKALAPTILASTMLIQTLKQINPFTQQNIFESLDLSIGKIAATVGTGALAAVAGLRRAPPALRENLESFGDSLTTVVRRGAFLGGLRELVSARDEGNDAPIRVLDVFSADPNALGETARRKIGQAINEGKDIVGTINNLMDQPSFRRRLERDEQRLRRQLDKTLNRLGQ